MRKSGKLALWVAVASLVGCVHAGPNINKVSAVKSAAIVGFGGEVDLNDENSSGRVSSGLAAIQGMKDINSPQTQARRLQEAEAAYDALAQRLSTQMGWSVLSRDAVAANPLMQQMFHDRMGQRRVNAGFRFGIPNIPWAEVAELSADKQKELKEALGVDTLIIARVQVRSGRTYGYGAMGEGTFDVYAKGILNFAAYDGTGGPIWREPAVVGANTQSKVKRNMGVLDTDNEAPVVAEATQLAADALVQKYAAAKGAAPAAAAAP